jgi:CheY-like chemotaxis protein
MKPPNMIYDQAPSLPPNMTASGKESRELFAALSHEIRTLMNSVIGFGDLLQKTSLDSLQKEYVAAIHDSACRLVAIINEMQERSGGPPRIAAPREETAQSIKGMSVLVVEDDSLNQKLMGILLRRMECLVDIAKNGHEAILKAGGKKYDVILMDIQMPLMDGLEATEFLRTHLQNDTPIIALTAKASKDVDAQCIAAGMNDFLSKPVEIGTLKAKILKWTKGR